MEATPQPARRRRTKRPEMQVPPLDPLRRYTVDAATAYLGICKAQIYKRAKIGALSLIREGGRTFVPGSEIARLCSVPSPEPRA